MPGSTNQEEEVSNGRNNITTRRRYLGAVGAGATIGLAGCIGGGDDDENTVSIMTTHDESSAYAMAQGIATVVTENSDLEVENLPVPGAEQGLRRMDNGEVNFAMGSGYVMNEILTQTGGYADNPLENDPMMMFRYYDIAYYIVTTPEKYDEGIQSVADLDGARIYNRGQATATYPILLQHYDYVFDSDNVETVDAGASEAAGLLNSGEIDAYMMARPNWHDVPGYQEEIYASMEPIILGWPEDAVEQIQDESGDTGLQGQFLTAEELEDYGGPSPEYRDIDRTWIANTTNSIHATDETSEDLAYEFLDAIWENREELSGYHALLADWEDDDFMRSWPEYLPIDLHPGAERFWDEN